MNPVNGCPAALSAADLPWTGHRVGIAVIGSGPGGAVTATLLAEAGQDVAIFEEGPLILPEETQAFSPEEMTRKLRNNGLTMALGAAPVAFWEGRCVGGGSEVNRGLYHRPSPEVIADWADRHGVDGLDADDMVARAIDCERTARVELLPGPAPAVSTRLAKGAAALGWSSMEVPRLFAYAADWQHGVTPGRKQSMATTFLPRCLAAGGALYTGARARRLRQLDGRWQIVIEVTARNGRRETRTILADRVVVACGATQTPALLRRSGITRGVGDTLAFHTMIKVVARFDDPVSADTRLDPVHQVKHFDPRFSLGASVSLPETTTFGLTDRPELLHGLARDWPFLGTYYAQTTGGRGSVRLLPGFDDPLIRTIPQPQDLVDLAEGMKRLCEALFAAGAREIYPNIAGGGTLRSPADVDRLPASLPLKRVSLSTLHMLASCRMGRDPACVVDSFGRLRDAEGIWLADSAILPGPTVVNPQGTIMAMAHRNAERMLDAVAPARQRAVSHPVT